jgi:hypothetical protein
MRLDHAIRGQERSSPLGCPAWALSLLVAVVMAFAGCRSADVVDAPGIDPLRLVEQSSPAPQLMGQRPGIEVRSWVTLSDYSRLVGELERAGSRPASVRGAPLSVLNANGLQVFVLPRAALDTVQRRLQPMPALPVDGEGDPGDARPISSNEPAAPTDSPTGPRGAPGGLVAGISRSWVDQGGRWVEAIRGRTLRRERAFELHDGVVWLGPGMLRMLVRCWVSPEVEPGPPARRAVRMRIELVPQLRDPGQPGALVSLLEARTRADPIDEGLVLHRLLCAVLLDPGEVLVLVTDRQDQPPEPPASPPGQGADPGTEADRPPRPGELARRETLPSQSPHRTAGSTGSPGAWPEVPDRDAGLRTTTIGQELLTARVGSRSGGGARLVVVMVPTIPGGAAVPDGGDPAR